MALSLPPDIAEAAGIGGPPAGDEPPLPPGPLVPPPPSPEAMMATRKVQEAAKSLFDAAGLDPALGRLLSPLISLLTKIVSDQSGRGLGASRLLGPGGSFGPLPRPDPVGLTGIGNPQEVLARLMGAGREAR